MVCLVGSAADQEEDEEVRKMFCSLQLFRESQAGL